MRPLRLSVFLPRPTGFYRGLLPQMMRGFEQAGFEVSGTTELLGEAEMLDWCRSHKTDVVFEMNRTRSEVPFLPRSILHISWVVDFLGRTEAQIKGSDMTYFFTTGWVMDFPYDTFSDWLPPGSCPTTYAPSGAAFESDVSVAGHVPPPWSAAELTRSVSRTARPMLFADLLPQYQSYLEEVERNILTQVASHGTHWDAINRLVSAATGDVIVDDPAIKYDLLGRLPRTGLRQSMVSEALGARHSLRIFGTKGWTAWPELAPHYRGFLDEPAQLAQVFNSSRINLHEGVGMHFRSMDCLAAGSLLFYCTRRKSTDPHGPWNWRQPSASMSDYHPPLLPGEHYVEYYPGELAEKSRYYLARPEQIEKLRNNARHAVLEGHTWRHRALKIARDLEQL